MEKIYTMEEVAELSKFHLNSVYRHIRTGKLKAHRVGGVWRITETNLKEYLYGKEKEEN